MLDLEVADLELMRDGGWNACEEEKERKHGKFDALLEVERRRAAEGEGLRLGKKIEHGCSMRSRRHAVASGLIVKMNNVAEGSADQSIAGGALGLAGERSRTKSWCWKAGSWKATVSKTRVPATAPAS
ncbi:hypothetical protein, partial [Mesorhizobium sp. M1C.F.Ca.ET.144.01.1.1]|uniref:hypothetical protein n=1 Tax=Mesorhizobium sp. M1C.F.Ca.ET.144.01.1.1 TaxID=2563921 RepID=UPI00167B0557